MTTNLKPKITEELDKYEAELRKTQPKISETKSKKCAKLKKKKLTNEIKTYIRLFLRIIPPTII
ncbi:hypothetical protein [Methanobrevibacter sp. A27]|nr:hypothetical protein [Methanobrevibacter sp. A27]